MDRNLLCLRVVFRISYVALRKESVDRNAELIRPSAACSVALRKESVDRNMKRPGVNYFKMEVALRKESVDRNILKVKKTRQNPVALRKESVDRNP